MARAATTADAFNAVAEPRRRQILDLLAGGERPVNDLVALLGQRDVHINSGMEDGMQESMDHLEQVATSLR
jgi:DNA-binding transcriptional ArsR family regulator